MNHYFNRTTYAAAGWAFAVCASAFALDMTPRGWVVAGILALVPAAAIVRYWNHAVPSMSQTIEEDLR